MLLRQGESALFETIDGRLFWGYVALVCVCYYKVILDDQFHVATYGDGMIRFSDTNVVR